MSEIPDPEFRVFALTLVHYQLSGWHIYDLCYSRRCRCCGESGLHTHKNITGTEVEAERAKFLASGPIERCFDVEAGSLDSYIRFQDDRVGAYDPDGFFVPWPISNYEILDTIVESELLVTRRQGQSVKLSMWFVREILHSYDEKRVWQDADWHGAIMKGAADLLKRYDADTIAGCLEANRDGLIGDGFDLTYITAIEKSGEPPLIAQWLAYRQTPPAVYLEYETQQWLMRKDKHYPELEPDPGLEKKPKATRKKKTKPTQGEMEL